MVNPPPPTATQLLELPRELLVQILSNLPFSDLRNCALCCREVHPPLVDVLLSRSGNWMATSLPLGPTESVLLLLRAEQRRATARRHVAEDTAVRAAELNSTCDEKSTAVLRLESAAQAAVQWWRRSGPAPPGLAAHITESWGLIQLLHDARPEQVRRVSLAVAAVLKERQALLEADRQELVDLALARLRYAGAGESETECGASRTQHAAALLQFVETAGALTLAESDAARQARHSALLLRKASHQLRRLALIPTVGEAFACV